MNGLWWSGFIFQLVYYITSIWACKTCYILDLQEAILFFVYFGAERLNKQN